VSAARVAAIDIGTNSVLLLIAEPREGVLQALIERATITRLGQDVDARRALAPEAARRTLSCLESYARELRAFGVGQVAAVGTSALRDAAGGSEFLDQAEALLGVRPRVISGREEAELTFHGSLSGLPTPAGAVCVFDIGGGSTEIIRGRTADGSNSIVEHALSLDIGSVRLFERHLRHDPALPAEMALIDADIARALAAAGTADPAAVLVGVAGTVTTLAAIELALPSYDSARVHGFTLTRAAVDALAKRLATLTVAQRLELAGLEPKRADVIVVGAAILRSILDWSGRAELVVSDRGVRWGLAERLSNSA
jgi:exopolyphosphatase/guanosine-5'-triphosphate,3'-diphosphate pyrophosphatase